MNPLGAGRVTFAVSESDGVTTVGASWCSPEEKSWNRKFGNMIANRRRQCARSKLALAGVGMFSHRSFPTELLRFFIRKNKIPKWAIGITELKPIEKRHGKGFGSA